MSTDVPSSALIHFRLTGEKALALKQLAAREYRTPRDQVRHLLDAYLEADKWSKETGKPATIIVQSSHCVMTDA